MLAGSALHIRCASTDMNSSSRCDPRRFMLTQCAERELNPQCPRSLVYGQESLPMLNRRVKCSRRPGAVGHRDACSRARAAGRVVVNENFYTSPFEGFTVPSELAGLGRVGSTPPRRAGSSWFLPVRDVPTLRGVSSW